MELGDDIAKGLDKNKISSLELSLDYASLFLQVCRCSWQDKLDLSA
ncbi:hypothetical protein ACVNPZ_06355 [Staphylococcus aureus]